MSRTGTRRRNMSTTNSLLIESAYKKLQMKDAKRKKKSAKKS